MTTNLTGGLMGLRRRLADIVSEFRPLSLGTLRGLTGHILTTIRPKELLCLISPRASGI